MVLRLCIIFAFLLMGCPNPYERDNPTDPAVVHRITFNANGATGGTAPAAVTGSYGDKVTLPGGGDLVRSGYALGGWTDPEGKTYSPGSSLTLTGSIAMSANWSPTYTGSYGSVAYEGQTYKTVVIGTQTWFAENLNYNASGSKCYSNSDSNCNTYGRLYDWATALTICPSGWHLPTQAEWAVMTAFIGGESTEGKKLKATTGWNSGGNGTNEYGFSALAGGNGLSDGRFLDVGDYGNWWSASEYYSITAYGRTMYYGGVSAYWNGYHKGALFSVRCVQD